MLSGISFPTFIPENGGNGMEVSNLPWFWVSLKIVHPYINWLINTFPIEIGWKMHLGVWPVFYAPFSETPKYHLKLLIFLRCIFIIFPHDIRICERICICWILYRMIYIRLLRKQYDITAMLDFTLYTLIHASKHTHIYVALHT